MYDVQEKLFQFCFIFEIFHNSVMEKIIQSLLEYISWTHVPMSEARVETG